MSVARNSHMINQSEANGALVLLVFLASYNVKKKHDNNMNILPQQAKT